MIRSRKSRVTMLTMWALIVFGIFFIFHKGTESRTSAFIDKLDDLVKAQTDEPSNRNKAISNEPGEPFDPEKEYNDILNEAPIVIFSKSYCPHSMFVKELLLEKYQINPIPIVVELDQHPNGLQLQRHIGAITGRKTVPNVHILSTSRGGGDEFRALEAEGNVISQIKQWANDKVLIEKIVV